jgi:hypothetical protein
VSFLGANICTVATKKIEKIGKFLFLKYLLEKICPKFSKDCQSLETTELKSINTACDMPIKESPHNFEKKQTLDGALLALLFKAETW